jgi:hypothetical protein
MAAHGQARVTGVSDVPGEDVLTVAMLHESDF